MDNVSVKSKIVTKSKNVNNVIRYNFQMRRAVNFPLESTVQGEMMKANSMVEVDPVPFL
jgi:hypothetical protein